MENKKCSYCGVELQKKEIKEGFKIGQNICNDCYECFIKENDLLSREYDL